MSKLRSALVALPFLLAGGAAFAGSFSGSYQVTVKKSSPAGYDGPYCVTLSDDGSVLGWAHSGPVTIKNSQGKGQGFFFVAGKSIMVTISYQGADVVFSGPVGKGGLIGAASVVGVENGAPVLSGIITSGPKGSC